MSTNKVIKNAAWIIACKIIQAILTVIITALTARFLGPSNYGIINYAAAIVTFFAPMMTLGLNAVLVQEIVNAPEKEGEILGSAIGISLVSAVLCIAGVVAFTAIVNWDEPITIIVCALYSILLLFQCLEMIQYWFQAKLKSKYPSIVMLIAYVVTSAYKVFLLVTGKSIFWFAISQAFDFALISISLFAIYRKIGKQKVTFAKAMALRLFSRSKHYILSNMMVAIYNQTDRVMIKLMVGDEFTGFYSAAVTCATMASFIFVALIDSARPSIFEKKKIDECLFDKNLTLLYSIIIYFSLITSLSITILAEPIVLIMYGSAYHPAVPILRISVWFSTFSYLGTIRNIWLLAEEKQKYLWVINITGAIANIAINYLLIPIFGAIGAAYASLLTQFFSNVVMGFILKPIRPNNRMMLNAINPRIIVSEITR